MSWKFSECSLVSSVPPSPPPKRLSAFSSFCVHFLLRVCDPAKGRTNMELREKFILADGTSQGMAAFRPRGRRSRPSSRGASPNRSTSVSSHAGQAASPQVPVAASTPKVGLWAVTSPLPLHSLSPAYCWVFIPPGSYRTSHIHLYLFSPIFFKYAWPSDPGSSCLYYRVACLGALSSFRLSFLFKSLILFFFFFACMICHPVYPLLFSLPV